MLRVSKLKLEKVMTLICICWVSYNYRMTVFATGQLSLNLIPVVCLALLRMKYSWAYQSHKAKSCCGEVCRLSEILLPACQYQFDLSSH